jgi:hypothetical protein
MTTLTYNNFKSTTVKGNFCNLDDTVNNIPANANFSGNMIIGSPEIITPAGQPNIFNTLLINSETTINGQTNINGDAWFNKDVAIGTLNNLFSVNSPSYFELLATFYAGINTNSIILNGNDLATMFNDYVLTSTLSNYALTSTFSNYVLSSTLNNLTIPKLTFNNSVSVKQLMLYNVNSSTNYNNLCISVELGTLRYNVNDPTNDSHVFSSANNNITGTSFTDILRLNSTGSTLYNRLTVPSITLNGVDLATTLSTFLTSAPSLTGYANLTAASNTFTGNAIFSTGNVNIGTMSSPYTQLLDVYSTATFVHISTFQEGLTSDIIIYNGTELTTLLNNYITSTSLNTTLSNYATTSSLNNLSNSTLTTSTITFNNSISVKQLMLYKIANNNYNNLCISVEPSMIRYNVNDPTNDCHVFSSSNSSTSGTGFTEILRLNTINSTLNSNLNVNGYIKKKVTYINLTPDQTTYFYYMTADTITPYYFIGANNATNFGFYCILVPPEDGIEIVIKNLGSYSVNVYNIIPNGLSSIPITYSLPSGFQLKIASFNSNWYQI